MLRKTVRNAAPKLKRLPFKHMIPNMVTLCALAAGFSALRFAAQDKWEPAVIAIFVAAVLDGLDGRVARLLRGTSRFGAELDSLSDFLSFGVAPAMLHYLWAPSRGLWIISILFCMSSALRLARFNTMLDEEPQPSYWSNFFVGVPAPAGAIIALSPIMLNLHFAEEFFRSSFVSGIFLALSAGLMVSQIPTFSLKKVKVPVSLVVPMLLVVGLLAGSIISQPWLTFSVLSFVYLLSVPVSVYVFLNLKKAAEKTDEKTEDKEAAPQS